MWLLGPPGWRRLDIILPENRWTLAADDDDVLHTWVKLLEDVAPEKPVMRAEISPRYTAEVYRRDIPPRCRASQVSEIRNGSLLDPTTGVRDP